MFGSLFGRRGRKSPPRTTPDSLEDSIREADVGDLVSISDLSLDYGDVFFLIERVHRYKNATEEWHELLGTHREKRILIEWTEEEELSVTVAAQGSPLGLSSIGLTEEDLIRLDEQHSIDNSIQYQGKTCFYRNSSEGMYYQDNKGNGEVFYIWEFKSEDGHDVISVFKWKDTPFQVFASATVGPESIKVYKR
jgi:hypothetical protein